MKNKDISQLKLENLDVNPFTHKSVILNKEKFVEVLTEIANAPEINSLKSMIFALKDILGNYEKDREGILNISRNGDTVLYKKDVLISELNQILEAKTKERAIYYINRLIKAIQKEKTGKINDINLLRWKEYEEIITDSLWILDKRDTSGAHLGWYWGNFIPQIPHQMILRYTKKGEWVLDPFVGSGTTLIECRRLGRNGIGIELNEEVAQKAKNLIENEENIKNVISDVIIGDSKAINLEEILKYYNIKQFQLIIMHPPYHDIIKFSKDKNDLSNAKNTKEGACQEFCV